MKIPRSQWTDNAYIGKSVSQKLMVWLPCQCAPQVRGIADACDRCRFVAMVQDLEDGLAMMRLMRDDAVKELRRHEGHAG